MQLLDSDWPANILAGSHFRAQETRTLSPDAVCALALAQLGTRLGTECGCHQTLALRAGPLRQTMSPLGPRPSFYPPPQLYSVD